MRDFFLLISIAAFASGIVIGTLSAVSWSLLGFIALAASIVLLFSRSTVGVVLALCMLCAVLGIGRVALTPSIPPESFLPLFDTAITLEGKVMGDPDIRETSQRVTVAVQHGGATMRLLAVAPLYPMLQYGEQVEVRGKLEHPEPFDTDGGRVFRYDQYLAKDGIFGIVQYAQVERVGEPTLIDQMRGSLYTLKHAFIAGLERALPEPYAALASGLIAGGKQGLGRELLDAFTVAGLIHIVVLSGYNIMIVAEGVLKGFSFLPRRTAASIAAVTIALFVLAAGAGTASVRAGIMAGLGLFARATGRSYDALRAVLFVFVLMIVWNPYTLVYDPGFQFSFMATLGLILAASTFETYLTWVRPAFLRDILATTLAAQLFVLPLLLYQTGNLSLIALPANLLALPLVPLAMLFGAIAGVAGMVIPAVASVVALPALLLLSYLIAVARTAAMLPFASVIVPSFSFILVPVLYALLFWGMYLLKRNTPAKAGVS